MSEMQKPERKEEAKGKFTYLDEVMEGQTPQVALKWDVNFFQIDS